MKMTYLAPSAHWQRKRVMAVRLALLGFLIEAAALIVWAIRQIPL